MLLACTKNEQGCSCGVTFNNMCNLISEAAIRHNEKTDIFKISYNIASEMETKLKEINNVAILTLVMSMLIHELAHKIEDEVDNRYMNMN